MLETYALCEILKSFWHNGESVRHLYFFRDANKKEVDFILEKNMTLYPVEVKKTTLSCNFANLNILKNLKKQLGKGAVICLAPNVMPIPNKNAFTVPVWEI
jgi:predicted AAA+ superfamily ATPase